MSNTYFCMLLLLVFFAYILTGCDYATIEERIIYEDRMPVQRALVTAQCDSYIGSTITDSSGSFTLYVPPDTVLKLCAEEYDRDIGKACYDGDLLTPSLDSKSTELQRI